MASKFLKRARKAVVKDIDWRGYARPDPEWNWELHSRRDGNISKEDRNIMEKKAEQERKTRREQEERPVGRGWTTPKLFRDRTGIVHSIFNDKQEKAAIKLGWKQTIHDGFSKAFAPPRRYNDLPLGRDISDIAARLKREKGKNRKMPVKK